MHFVERFLDVLAERVDLAAPGIADDRQYLFLTPRFEASRHVVVLVSASGQPKPALIVKIPRRPADDRGIVTESTTLCALAELWPAGTSSIPAVLACEMWDGHRLLVETALPGSPLSHRVVREDPHRALAVVGAWLTGMPVTGSTGGRPGAWENLLDEPLASFDRVTPWSAEIADLVIATKKITSPLRDLDLPLVVEHGDLSHPNLLLEGFDQLGVIDWELSRADGLVGYDLFVFLAYVAFARQDAHDLPAQTAALDEAFFVPGAWGREFAERHLRTRGVGAEQVTALMVACWARY